MNKQSTRQSINKINANLSTYQKACKECGAIMPPTHIYWKEYCSDRCRNKRNNEARKIGLELLKKQERKINAEETDEGQY